MSLLTYDSKHVIQSATAVNTSSTSFIDDTQASHELTISATKTVLVIYIANCNHGDTLSATGLKSAISVDGTDYCIMSETGYADNYAVNNTCFWVGSLPAGTYDITGRLASAGSGTVTVSNRTLLIYIFNGTEFTYINDATAQATSSTDYVDDSNATATFTPSGACKALVLYAVGNDYNVTENYRGKNICINVDSSDISATVAQQSTTNLNYADSICTVYATSLTAASHTIKGRLASNAGDVTASRSMMAILLLSADFAATVHSSTTQKSTTSTSLADDDVSGLDISVSGAGELLLLAQACTKHGTATSGTGIEYGIKLDSSDVVVSRASTYDSGFAQSVFVAYGATVETGTHTIKGRLANNNGSTTSNVDTRILISLFLESTTSTIDCSSSVSGSGSATTKVTLRKPLTSVVYGSGSELSNVFVKKYLSSTVSGVGSETSSTTVLKLIASTSTSAGSVTSSITLIKPSSSSTSGTGSESSYIHVAKYLNTSATGTGCQTSKITLSKLLLSSVLGAGGATANVSPNAYITSSVSGTGSNSSSILVKKYLTSANSGSGASLSCISGVKYLSSSILGTGTATATCDNTGESSDVGGIYPSGLYPPGLYPAGLYPININIKFYIAVAVSGVGNSTASVSVKKYVSSATISPGVTTAKVVNIVPISSQIVGISATTIGVVKYLYLSSQVSGIGRTKAKCKEQYVFKYPLTVVILTNNLTVYVSPHRKTVVISQ